MKTAINPHDPEAKAKSAISPGFCFLCLAIIIIFLAGMVVTGNNSIHIAAALFLTALILIIMVSPRIVSGIRSILGIFGDILKVNRADIDESSFQLSREIVITEAGKDALPAGSGAGNSEGSAAKAEAEKELLSNAESPQLSYKTNSSNTPVTKTPPASIDTSAVKAPHDALTVHEPPASAGRNKMAGSRECDRTKNEPVLIDYSDDPSLMVIDEEEIFEVSKDERATTLVDYTREKGHKKPVKISPMIMQPVKPSPAADIRNISPQTQPPQSVPIESVTVEIMLKSFIEKLRNVR